MSVRMRHTKGHTGNRRSHHALSAPRITKDTVTGSFHLRHRLDLKTGMYRGKKILEPQTPLRNAHSHDHAPVEEKVTKKSPKKTVKKTQK